MRHPNPSSAAQRVQRLAAPRIAGLPALLFAGLFAMLLAALARPALGQEIDFHAPAWWRDAQTAIVMRDLAQRVLPVYQEKNPERYLGYLSALQLVAGDYAAADATRASLARRRNAPDAGLGPRGAALYDIYVHARAIEARDRTGFDAAFTQAYRDALGRLSDKDAYAVTGLPPVALSSLEAALQGAFDAHRSKTSLMLPEAVELVWTYFAYEAYRRMGALAETLGAEDDRRRYLSDERVVIRAPDGTRLAAVVVRPRASAQPRPTLMEFTIHSGGRNIARECASRGYVGVVAYARGAGRSSGSAVPFEHDGADAETVIDWIARQPWSDGRVAMYGEGYSGFTAWAAARRGPPALKAIAGADAMAPGISFPMVGNIFQNSAFEWLAQVARAGAPGKAAVSDPERWQALYRNGYTNGDPSGDLDGLLGQPSPILHRWLDHPEYDGYWQGMIPYREQFAKIDIPVLSSSGYYAAAQVGAIYYFREHNLYHPNADHTLLLGPYGDAALQEEPVRGPPGTYAADSPARPQTAFPSDPGAAVALRELRYQWFDFVLRGGARPALLRDRVNYEVAGADTWRHVPSIAAMANGTLRLYLARAGSGENHRLDEKPGPENTYVHLSVDLADRHDVDAPTTGGARNAVVFASEPLAQALEMGGAFLAHLELLINKRDVDLTIALYERRAGGETVRLFDPAFEVRASNAGDRSHRHLLAAGVRQPLDVNGERLASRLLQAGSRLVLVLGVNKRPDQEINLGTGRNVRDEYVEYAGPPLDIRWYGSSYIELPVRR